MAKFPSDNPLKVTAADEAKIREMDVEQIKEYLKDKMVEQNLATRDYYDSTVLHATSQATDSAQEQPVHRDVVINGATYTLQAANESELNAMELELHRRLLGGESNAEPSTAEPSATKPSRDASGRFISDEDKAIANAALEADLGLKLRRGEISIAQYMKQSPDAEEMIDNHLKRNYGVDREALRDKRYVADWQEAVSRWLSESEIGRVWEGGETNRAILEKLIQDNAEQFSDDTVEERIAVLDACAEYARENNMLIRNPEIELREATNFDDIRNKAHEASGMPPLYARLNSQWGDRR